MGPGGEFQSKASLATNRAGGGGRHKKSGPGQTLSYLRARHQLLTLLLFTRQRWGCEGVPKAPVVGSLC